jgi:hypothetical protein
MAVFHHGFDPGGLGSHQAVEIVDIYTIADIMLSSMVGTIGVIMSTGRFILNWGQSSEEVVRELKMRVTNTRRGSICLLLLFVKDVSR